MQKGLKTRYTIYAILKILKNYSVNFDQVYLEKIKDNKFSKSDQKDDSKCCFKFYASSFIN